MAERPDKRRKLMIGKQRHVAQAALTVLAAGAVVRRARRQRKECAPTHGFRRMGRRVQR